MIAEAMVKKFGMSEKVKISTTKKKKEKMAVEGYGTKVSEIFEAKFEWKCGDCIVGKSEKFKVIVWTFILIFQTEKRFSSFKYSMLICEIVGNLRCFFSTSTKLFNNQ